MSENERMNMYLKLAWTFSQCGANRRNRRRFVKTQSKDPQAYEILKCDIIIYYCAGYLIYGNHIPICSPEIKEKIRNVEDVPTSSDSEGEDNDETYLSKDKEDV
jgi:hypothetical protein